MVAERLCAEAALAPLKAFQRRTVDSVFRRLYTDDDAMRQFLVADEVGLGKTMVARGVIGKPLEPLYDLTKRMDHPSHCSSQNNNSTQINHTQYTTNLTRS